MARSKVAQFDVHVGNMPVWFVSTQMMLKCSEPSLRAELKGGNQKKKTHFVGLFFLTGLRLVLPLGLLTHFSMEHGLRSGNQKKKTRFAGLFFLTGLRPVLPLGQCPPSIESDALYWARYMQKRAIEILNQKEQRVWSELLMVWCER